MSGLRQTPRRKAASANLRGVPEQIVDRWTSEREQILDEIDTSLLKLPANADLRISPDLQVYSEDSRCGRTLWDGTVCGNIKPFEVLEGQDAKAHCLSCTIVSLTTADSGSKELEDARTNASFTSAPDRSRRAEELERLYTSDVHDAGNFMPDVLEVAKKSKSDWLVATLQRAFPDEDEQFTPAAHASALVVCGALRVLDRVLTSAEKAALTRGAHQAGEGNQSRSPQ